MSRILFENSKFALGFAAVTLVGAGVLMGTDNSLSGVELEREAEPAPVRPVAATSQPKAAPTPLGDQPEIADWASDEELIDMAEGFDPSPEETVELVEGAPPAPGSGNGGSGARAPSSHARPGGRPEGASAAPSQQPEIPSGSQNRSRALDVK